MSVSVVKGIYLFLRFLKQDTNYRIINTKKRKEKKKGKQKSIQTNNMIQLLFRMGEES